MITKIGCWLAGAIVSLIVAAIPETVMYFLYHLIQPQTELTRILVLSFFWLGGAGACIGFAALGAMIFMSVTQAVLQ